MASTTCLVPSHPLAKIRFASNAPSHQSLLALVLISSSQIRLIMCHQKRIGNLSDGSVICSCYTVLYTYRRHLISLSHPSDNFLKILLDSARRLIIPRNSILKRLRFSLVKAIETPPNVAIKTLKISVKITL